MVRPARSLERTRNAIRFRASGRWAAVSPPVIQHRIVVELVFIEELTSRVATDYDAPRRGDVDELNEDSLEELKARRAEAQSGSIDVDETELAESLELPGADLSSVSGEELTVRVLPKQDDEFTCSSCFLVHHRSRLAREKNGQPICRDCA
jgi:formylmethanofuran dehydrogenase subunit E